MSRGPDRGIATTCPDRRWAAAACLPEPGARWGGFPLATGRRPAGPCPWRPALHRQRREPADSLGPPRCAMPAVRAARALPAWRSGVRAPEGNPPAPGAGDGAATGHGPGRGPAGLRPVARETRPARAPGSGRHAAAARLRPRSGRLVAMPVRPAPASSPAAMRARRRFGRRHHRPVILGREDAWQRAGEAHPHQHLPRSPSCARIPPSPP